MKETLYNTYRILGADGEGYFNTEDTTHAYDVFTVGNRTISGNGSQIDIFHIAKAIKAETEAALEAGEKPIFIGYFYTYDANQQIKSLDEFELERLYNTPSRSKQAPKPKDYPRYKKAHTIRTPVNIDSGDKFSPDRFKLDVMEGKYMKWSFPIESTLTKARFKQDDRYIKWNTVYVQDVGTIFGTSFIKAMSSFQVPLSDEESDMLYGGKANRAINATYDERADMLNEIIRYNRLEIRLIYRLIIKMIEALRDVGVNVNVETDLSGIGSLAGKYLAQQAEKEEILPSYEVAEILTPEVYTFINDGYFGGWAETFRPGLHPSMCQVDITSAYPHTMRNLPSLKDALVSKVNSIEHAHNAYNAGAIVYVDIEFEAANDYIGPLPFRTDTDSVIRPQWGRGKYLLAEVIAADNARLLKSVVFHSGWAITIQSDAKPFQYVEDMFFERLRVGKKTVQGAMNKVLMNSQYGKLAQSVGNPKFANPVYASLITAGARIQLLEAIGTHQGGHSALLATATDAVFFSTPHNNLDETPNTLGKWEATYYKKSFLLKPGIWGGVEAKSGEWGGIIEDAREEDSADDMSVKTRGISQASFVQKLYDKVIPTLEQFEQCQQWDADEMFETENSFSMMTLGEAFNRGRLDEVGEFMTGEHGTPELIREVHFNLAPKRKQVRWEDGTGFITSAPALMGEHWLATPVSQPCPRLIGNVDFD